MKQTRPESRASKAIGYMMAALGVALTALIRTVLDPVLGPHVPLLIFVLPALAAAVYRGLGPGLFAALLGAVAGTYLFVESSGSVLGSVADYVRLLIYFAESVAVVAVGALFHEKRRRAAAEAEQVRESEARYRAFFNLVGVGTGQVDVATGRYTEVNDALCRITGYTREEMLQKTFYDITHPEDRALDAERYQPLRDGRIPAYWTEKRYVRKDGSVIWVRLDVAAVRHSTGELLRSVAIVQDITERKRADIELARQSAAAEAERRRLRAVLEVLPIAVFIVDAGGKVQETNRGAAEVWGGDPKFSAIPDYGEDYKGWWPQTGRRLQSHEWGMARALTRGEHVIGEEVEIETFDGQRRAILNYALPIRDEEGRITGGVTVNVDITDRKRAENTLRESEQRLRATFENAGVGISESQSDGRIVIANARFCEIAGRSLEELLQLTVQDITHPEDREVSARLHHELREGLRRSFTQEKRYVRPDGSAVWVRVTISAIRDEAGKLLRAVAVADDISERKQAEAALAESEARLRLAIESTGLGTFDYNPQTKKLVWNEFAYRQFGVSQEEEVTGELFRRGVHPDDFGRVTELVERAMRKESGGHYAAEFRIIGLGDGELRWVAAWGRVFFDAEDRPVRFIGVSLDITERKRAEEALLESERRERARAAELEAIMAATPVATFISRDPDCREMVGNRASYELLHQPPGGNLSKTAASPERRADFRAVKDGRDIPDDELPMQRAGRTGKAVRNYEFDFVFADGSRRTVLGDAVPLLDSDGRPWGMVAAFMDITERKRAEEHLRQSQKLESVGLLAGGIAHDFNNLLVGIVGNASLAQELLPPGNPAKELLDSVVKIGEQAAHLTRQMLAYAGKGKFVVEPLNLSEVVPEMTELLRPSLSGKIALHMELDRNVPSIEADRGQIQQVFMNLMLNAAEAIGGNAGLIAVSTGVQEPDGGAPKALVGEPEPGRQYVFLQVRDTGSGMDEAIKSRIFDPFFSTKFTGRGLGLAAVAGIVRTHGGAIQVESTPGKGACFTVLFPAMEAAEAAPAAAPRQEAVRGSGTILVVDDEEVVRRVAQKSLERFGYKVLTAEGGRAAIDVFKRYPGEIAAVILDLSMPEMSGEETLPELHRIRPTVKILISSGYSEAEAKRRLDNRQVAGFIEKPYTSAKLAEKVKSALG